MSTLSIILIVSGYLVVGLVFSVVIGRTGFFDYTPTRDQVNPNFLKYVFAVMWPLLMAALLVEGILFSARWLNAKFNEVCKVRVERQR